MIPEIKKILFATDLSPNSAHAFRYAAASARKHEARIVVLHVVEPLPATAKALVSVYLDDQERKDLEGKKRAKLLEIVHQRIKNLCEAERGADPGLSDRIEAVEVVDGYPADVILKKADAFHCDLIVIGTHGKGVLRTAILGSVSHGVLRHAHTPTCVIPLPPGGEEIPKPEPGA